MTVMIFRHVSLYHTYILHTLKKMKVQLQLLPTDLCALSSTSTYSAYQNHLQEHVCQAKLSQSIRELMSQLDYFTNSSIIVQKGYFSLDYANKTKRFLQTVKRPRNLNTVKPKTVLGLRFNMQIKSRASHNTTAGRKL